MKPSLIGLFASLLLVAPVSAQRATSIPPATSVSAKPKFNFHVIESPLGHADHRFGSSVAVLDFDADGVPDLVIGAPGESGNAGVVYLYIGPNYTTPHTRLDAADSASGDRFGTTLGVGEFDGYPGDELLVGAPEKIESGLAGAGAVYSFSDRTAQKKMVASDPQANAEFGSHITVGDFTGNGINTIAIGARMASAGGGLPTAGKVYFFERSGAEYFELFSLPCPDQGTESFNSNFGARLDVHKSGGATHGLVVSRMAAPVGAYKDAGVVDYFQTPIAAASTPTTSFLNPYVDEDQNEHIRWGWWVDVIEHGGNYRLGISAPRQDRQKLDLTYAITTGNATCYEMNGGTEVFRRTYALPDAYADFEDSNYYGFRTVWGDLIGDATPDLVNLVLQDELGNREWRRLWIYDGADLAGPPSMILDLPYGSSDHPADAILAADLFPVTSTQELIMGDNRYSPDFGNLWIGRVLIAYR